MFYLVALMGMVMTLFVPAANRTFHWAFLPVLGGVWFTVTLTGAIMPRYDSCWSRSGCCISFAFVDGIAHRFVRCPVTHA